MGIIINEGNGRDEEEEEEIEEETNEVDIKQRIDERFASLTHDTSGRVRNVPVKSGTVSHYLMGFREAITPVTSSFARQDEYPIYFQDHRLPLQKSRLVPMELKNMLRKVISPPALFTWYFPVIFLHEERWKCSLQFGQGKMNEKTKTDR